MERIQPRFVEFGADVFLEFIPAVLFACHWEENLCREQRAVVVVGVQRPDGDAIFAAGLQLALGGVEVVETVDFDFVEGKTLTPSPSPGGRGEQEGGFVELVHEMLVRPSDRKDAQGRAIGYWPTLFNYVFDNRDRDYQRQQLQVDAQRWQERKRLGRWFGLAGWRDLRVFKHQHPRQESVEGRYLRRSRWMAWGQTALLVGFLGVLAESAWWATGKNLPFGYALLKPLWATGLYSPIPEMSEVIPAGKFTMGCMEGRDNAEGVDKCDEKAGYGGEVPAHEVTLTKPFQLGKYEVTFMEYDYYVWDQQRRGMDVDYPPDQGWGRYRQPVVNVSWDDATAYIGWLNERTGKSYRLPTEAEWEYAARGGKNDTAFPWGNALGEGRVNCGDAFCQDSYPNTAPVGSFAATPFGLHDMHGNVQEWVQDVYGDYPAESVSDPQGDAGGVQRAGVERVVRGGSWFNGGRYCRSAYRDRFTPDNRNFDVGFRLALGL